MFSNKVIVHTTCAAARAFYIFLHTLHIAESPAFVRRKWFHNWFCPDPVDIIDKAQNKLNVIINELHKQILIVCKYFSFSIKKRKFKKNQSSRLYFFKKCIL